MIVLHYVRYFFRFIVFIKFFPGLLFLLFGSSFFIRFFTRMYVDVIFFCVDFNWYTFLVFSTKKPGGPIPKIVQSMV